MATLKVGNNSQEVKDGENISAAAEAMGIPFSCHVGTCGTCLSSVESGRENLSEVTQEEKDFGLDGTAERLACQCKIKSGEVELKSSF